MKRAERSIIPLPFTFRWGVDQTIKAVNFSYFMAFGCYLPYANLYFGRLGFSGAEIGLLAAIPPLAALVAPPVVGALADVTGRRRDVLRVLLLLVSGAFALLLTVHRLAGVVAVMVCYGLAYSPLVPLMDSITLQHLRDRPERYGGYRLWGSLGFIAGSLVVGNLISRWGAGTWIYVYILSSVTASLLAGRLPRGASPASGGATASADSGGPGASGAITAPGSHAGTTAAVATAIPSGSPRSEGTPHGGMRSGLRRAADTLLGMWESLLSIVRRPDLAMFFGGVFLVFLAGATYYAFFSIYLDEMNVPEEWIGAAWTVGVASEVIMMLVSMRLLRRLGAKRLFCLGALGASLRWFLYASVSSVGAILAAQTLHAFSFAAVFIGAVNLVNQMTPNGRQSSAQSLLNSVSQGLALATGSLIAGPLSDLWGIRTLFLYSSGLALAGAVFVQLFVKVQDDDSAGSHTLVRATKGA